MKIYPIKASLATVLGIMLGLCGPQQSRAQLNVMGSGYYQNLYLFNPAMAGTQQQFRLYAGIRQQFNTVPGAPLSQTVAGDYALTKKAAVGLLFNNDKAGILKRQRLGGSFAYHLPLSAENRQLHLGVALTLSNDRVDQQDVNGNLNDPDIIDVNRRETYIDGGFGAAYTSNTLQVQFSLPNMKHVFKKDLYNAADRAVFFSSASYRFSTSLGDLEPKVVYRKVEGYNNLIDAGVNFEFASSTRNRLNTFALYHSAKSATFGFGITWNNSLGINGMYTTNTSPLQGYTNGDFEISISYGLFGKK